MMCKEKSTVITALENELRDKASRQNDEDKLYADLTGLFADIIMAIRKMEGADMAKSLVIYDYAKLLEQELQLYSGVDAYMMGEQFRGASADKLLTDYFCEMTKKNSVLQLDSKILILYNVISGLLGDSKGLIEDFTQVYNSVHGTIKKNIRDFILLGQNPNQIIERMVPA